MDLALSNGVSQLADRGVYFKGFLDDVISAAPQEVESWQLSYRFTLLHTQLICLTICLRVTIFVHLVVIRA